MITTIAQVSVLATIVSLSLFITACGDETTMNPIGMNTLDRGVQPVRLDSGRLDRGTQRLDAMVSPTRDTGTTDQGTATPAV